MQNTDELANVRFIKCGKVKVPAMKYHIMLKALSSLIKHSKHLKIYEKIGLSEQGKA